MNTIGIGAILRRERLSKGLTIEDIHLRTRIAPRFIQAIEADKLESLPGLIFTRNFVRQYSETLGLDTTELLAALPSLDECSLELPAPPPLSKPSWEDLRNNSALSSIAWLLMAIVAGGAGYLYFNRTEPQHPAEQAPVTRSAATTEPKPANIVKQAEKTAGLQVVISAREPSWISLTTDGRSAFTGTMAPNETKEISASDQIRLITGNAGGLSVSLNGKALDPLGPSGQVRVLRLTAEGPEYLSKAPPPTAPDPL